MLDRTLFSGTEHDFSDADAVQSLGDNLFLMLFQSIKQTMNLSISPSIGQSINQSIGQPTNQSIKGQVARFPIDLSRNYRPITTLVAVFHIRKNIRILKPVLFMQL